MRDLKLENILLDGFRNAKIIDFGFSTTCGYECKLKLFCGTPSYMSPEIVRRLHYVGFYSDMWALGVILYVLSTGELPFKSITIDIGQITNELYKLITKGVYDIPYGMAEKTKLIIQKLLQVNPEKRISASELLSEDLLTSSSSTSTEQ